MKTSSAKHHTARRLHAASVAMLVTLSWFGAPPAARGQSTPRDTCTVTRTDDLNRGACLPGDCSLREAVVAANASACYTVVLPAGTYNLTRTGRGEDYAATGDLDIRTQFLLLGDGPDASIIDAGGIDRPLDVIAGAGQPWVTGVTLRNGDSDLEPGGNVRAADDIWIEESYVIGGHNRLAGGGIDVGAGALVILSHVVVSDNQVAQGSSGICSGGGIRNAGTLGVINSSVLSNTVSNYAPAPCLGVIGGGIANSGQMVISGTTIAYNLAYNDYYLTGTALWAYAGGLYSSGAITVSNTTISRNRAWFNNPGGGTAAGGGLYGQGPSLLANVTIADNTVQAPSGEAYGGGLFSFNTGFPAIENTVVAGNHNSAGAQRGPDCYTFHPLQSLDYNLIGDTGGCTITGSVTHNIYNVDARLGPLQDNGGPTWTHALLPGSPAIDHGNNATCAPFDQRGIPRPMGASCDIGAFEVLMNLDYRSFFPFISWGSTH